MNNFYNTIKLNGKSFKDDALKNIVQQKLTLDKNHWERDIYLFISEWIKNKETIEVETSGSTGTPKKIFLKKQSMIYSALMTEKYFGLTQKIDALLCLPVKYIAGKMMIVRAFVSGFNLLLQVPTSNPFNYVKNNIEFAAITPFQFFHSHKSIAKINKGTIIIGGGKFSKELENKAKGLSVGLFETYGMTETCSHIAIRKINGVGSSEYFRVLSGVSITSDKNNCLIITAPHLVENKIKTTDIVEIKNQYEFKWLGRLDNVINSGGIKIYPEQLESKIQSILDRNYLFLGIPDSKLGQKLILVIEDKSRDKMHYVNLLKKKLTDYEIPQDIFFIEKFPISKNGKILRKQIEIKISEKLNNG